MATTLQGFIDELIPVIRDVSDINFVPDDPAATIPNFPAAIVYAESGRSLQRPAGVATYYQNITVAVLTNIPDLPHAHRIITPTLETIIEAIYTKFNAVGFTSVEEIGDINYSFQPTEWGGIDLIGFFLTLQDVKFQRVF